VKSFENAHGMSDAVPRVTFSSSFADIVLSGLLTEASPFRNLSNRY
jgi:hypothetical protein